MAINKRAYRKPGERKCIIFSTAKVVKLMVNHGCARCNGKDDAKN